MRTKLSDALDYSGVELMGNLPRQFCDRAALSVTRTAVQLTDHEYLRAKRKFIKLCGDVIFYYLDDAGSPVVFLPMRAHKPQPGRWVVGGQRTPFMLREFAMHMKVMQETGLKIEPGEFQEVPGEFEYQWAETEQGDPQGEHVVAKLFCCELDPEQRASIVLNDEYDCDPADCWFPLDEALQEEHNIHPALRAMLLAFRDRNSNFVHQHSDERRYIYEAVHKLDGGLVTRVTVITVTGDSVPLGNHYHPHNEDFKVQAGRGRLLTAPANDLTDVTEREFVAGESIQIPAGVAHTFVCDAGTVLVAITNWEFYPEAIVAAPLI